jgi:hypothetical protein
MFGRWIVDAGHYFKSTTGAIDPGFRTEIHPPLIWAIASTELKSGQGSGTRAVFTSRPYLVGQTYGFTGSIYQDGVGDDGTFYHHMELELAKLVLNSSMNIEAHPKIKSKPFRGTHMFHFIVRPPETTGHPGVGHLGQSALAQTLAISFNFTVRTGCTVEVTSDEAVANVLVAMNATTYQPPPLPARKDMLISKGELAAENKQAKDAIDLADKLTWLSIGDDDYVTGDEYSADLTYIEVLSDAGAVVDAEASSIPAGQGVRTDDTQVYPVTGWIEVAWQPSAQTHAGQASSPTHTTTQPPTQTKKDPIAHLPNIKAP